ncbi:MAG: hypothetical protein K5900_04625 [Butyrivibrio sp.]|nr:hypothetical protein [Butyrivibrio sp.]
MRITNKIMQNNSLYNINNNKVAEDQLNTMMSTGKRITRPSDDPVIAIRALRLRSNVTQLSQYYEKNAKDAESWLDVTADSLSTVTDVLTDCVKQATKGANMDLTLDDMSIIVTQMDALAKEYYSTGNVDYAGRYIFTGYRTDTSLSFSTTTTADYTDINDEFNSSDVGSSKRVLGNYLLESSALLSTDDVPLESDITECSVGKIRLSYDNLNYISGESNTATLKFREDLTQPATSTLSGTVEVINATYKTTNGETRYISVPIDTYDGTTDTASKTVTIDGITYTATANTDGTYEISFSEDDTKYTIALTEDGAYEGAYDEDGNPTDYIQSASTSVETVSESTITYTDTVDGTATQTTVTIPLLSAIGQTYTITLDGTHEATVNSDGTYTIKTTTAVSEDDGTTSNVVINVTSNGSIHSSYKEYSLTIDTDNIIYSTTSEEEIDAAYTTLSGDASETALAYLNAATGEVLLNGYLKDKLSVLPDIINANSIDVVYDKKEWESGDIRPENLFNCTYNYDDTSGVTQQILYNKGSAAHTIAYDVGFAQSVVVNTTADAVFTTDVKRDIDDLNNVLNKLKQIDSTITTLEAKLDELTEDTEEYITVQKELGAAQKSYNYLRSQLQEEFEHKITSMQKALDTANIAVTDNGTRSKRLDLINTRLMGQTTTFKTLQSENEDVDLAETITQLTSAQVTYEASLMATGKISQSSLMNYI